jgi:acyl-CoA hydrolase
MLLELLEGAGFVDELEVEAVDVELVETFDACWDRTQEMSRAGELIRALPAGEQASVRAALRERLAPYTDGDVLRTPGRTWVAAATA